MPAAPALSLPRSENARVQVAPLTREIENSDKLAEPGQANSKRALKGEHTRFTWDDVLVGLRSTIPRMIRLDVSNGSRAVPFRVAGLDDFGCHFIHIPGGDHKSKARFMHHPIIREPLLADHGKASPKVVIDLRTLVVMHKRPGRHHNAHVGVLQIIPRFA